jgi:alpha-amylase
MRRAFSLFTVLCLLLPLTGGASALPQGAAYEIFTPSYYDGDGDGAGDLLGIAQKAPYLASLSLGAVWLTPFYPSPSYHRYDVMDYRAVDPALGTLSDFKALADSLHEAGMKLIIDLVVNHSSSQHPWFLSAQNSLPIPPCGQAACPHPQLCRAHNPYVGYYNFSQGAGAHPVMGASGWYYHSSFGHHMPDFNLDNPSLREELVQIAAFWLDQGADGFRLDAVVHFYEENTARNTDFLRWLTQEVKAIRPDAFIIAEAWKDQNTILSLYDSGVDSFFNFPFSGADGHIMQAIREKQGAALAQKAAQWQNSILRINPHAADAPFLSNHDTGRSAGFLRMDARRMKQAAALYLMLPGVPFVYYGEEIGMTGSGRDENKRLPMLWSLTNDIGMVGAPHEADQAQRLKEAVDAQEENPDSLLHFYRHLLALRKACPALTSGKVEVLDLVDPTLMAYRATQGDESALVIQNLSDQALDVPITWQEEHMSPWDTGTGLPHINKHTLTLPPFSGCVWQ